jgi:type VI secretion system protein ImpL
MKSLFRKVGACLRQTWAWTLLCALCIGGLVWFFGPLLAIDDHKFWASPTARLLTISLLFLAWGLGMVFFNERSGKIEKPSQPDADPSRTLGQARVDDARREIRSRFKRALGTFPSVYSGGGKRSYKDLPWYLLIGPTASGKTSLLERSGVEFAFDGVERKPLLDMTGTRDCDWYCSDQAVLIDTAGRYLTQTDKQVDGSAWSVLLDLLRRDRRGRPLNGVLVAVPAEVLLQGCEEDVIDLAGQIRSRVQEIQRQLRANVPIYLVLSKADTIPGFNEFFDSLTREEADQVGRSAVATWPCCVASSRRCCRGSIASCSCVCTRSATVNAVASSWIFHNNWRSSDLTCACCSSWLSGARRVRYEGSI